MYQNTLSETAGNILGFMLHNLDKSFSIREIALAINQDYKISFTTIKNLAEQKIISIRRISNINHCNLNLIKNNSELFGFVSKRYAEKKISKRILNVIDDIKKDIENPFYISLIFGSYAKGTAKSSSDLDLAFIIQDHSLEPEILSSIKKSSLLNNIVVNPIFITPKEFKSGLKEKSVAYEIYTKHFIVNGGELFYSMIAND